MAVLLEPSWLAGYEWGTPARGTHGGRDVLSLHVTPRAGFAGPRVPGLLPSDLDVVIDAEFGFLHRLVGVHRDEPYQVVELLDLDLGPRSANGISASTNLKPECSVPRSGTAGSSRPFPG